MASVYFYCPFVPQPSGGIAVLLKFACILKAAGYRVTIIYNPLVVNPEAPPASRIILEFKLEWLDFPISDLEFLAMGQGVFKTESGKKLKLKERLDLGPSDVFVIPEGMANLMPFAASTDCKTVILAQSWSYILPNLPDGVRWNDFGIRDVLTVGDNIRSFIERYMPDLNISVVRYSIDRKLFRPAAKKRKLITYTCRDSSMEFKVAQAIKIFRIKNPHLSSYVFKPLRGLSRKEFAQQLGLSMFYIFNDDISGLPSAPLEAMACRTVTVGWKTYGSAEYASEKNGFWLDDGDIIGLGEELSRVVNLYEQGLLDMSRLYSGFDETLLNYREETERAGVRDYFESVFEA